MEEIIYIVLSVWFLCGVLGCGIIGGKFRWKFSLPLRNREERKKLKEEKARMKVFFLLGPIGLILLVWVACKHPSLIQFSFSLKPLLYKTKNINGGGYV
jgi:hypothetical protein